MSKLWEDLENVTEKLFSRVQQVLDFTALESLQEEQERLIERLQEEDLPMIDSSHESLRRACTLQAKIEQTLLLRKRLLSEELLAIREASEHLANMEEAYLEGAKKQEHFIRPARVDTSS